MLNRILATVAAVALVSCTPNKDASSVSEKVDTMVPATGDNKPAESAVDTAVDATSNAASSASNAVGAAADNAVDKGTEMAKNATSSVSAAMDSAKTDVENAANSAKDNNSVVSKKSNVAVRHGMKFKNANRGKNAKVAMKSSLKPKVTNTKSKVKVLSAARCPVIGLRNQKTYFTSSNSEYRTLLRSRTLAGKVDSRVCLSSPRVARKMGFNSSRFAKK
jgi:hypothetical protein